MKFTWPISKKIIATALIFGAATLTMREMGFRIPVFGTVHTDPRELFLTLGAALSGPIGGIVIGLMSISWSDEINAGVIASLVAHVLGGFFIGITYKKLVYQRLEFPWLLFGWAGLVISFYYLILIPFYILVFFSLDPVTFELTFGNLTLWNLYTNLVMLANPELMLTMVITSIIIAALPPKYRCPMWCQYDGSKMAAKNNYLAVRLALWFLVLSFLPLATVAIFVLNSVESGFDRLTLDHQRQQSQLLATALSNSTEPQIIPIFYEQYFTPQNSFNIIDLNGQYLFHPDSSKIGTLISTDFNKGSVGLILSGETKVFTDDHNKRVVGCARIKGQQKIVVTISDNDFANGIVSEIHRSSHIKLAIGFFIISIAGGVSIWLVVGHSVRQLTQSAQQISKGNLDIKLDPGGAVDELQVLSFTFNEMANQLRHLIKGLKEKVIELEETEEKLRYSENQYRSLNDNIPVGVFRSTLDGEILSINSALFQMLDLEDDNATNTIKAIKFYQNPEDRLGFLTAINSKKQIKGFECQLKRSDGSTFWASISARGIEGNDGQIQYIDGIIEDITSKRADKKQLLMLATVIDQTDEEVLITNPEGIIQYVNPSFEKNIGYSKEEILGQKPSILKSGFHDSAFYKSLWETILGEKNTWQGTIQNKCKSGQIIQHDVTISPILDSQNKISAFVSIRRDITQKIKMEQKVAQRTAQLSAMNISLQREITEREKAGQDLKASEAISRALSIRLQEVEEAHRKDIARELHDRVGQSLTALNINLNILQKQCLPEQKQKIGGRLQDSIDLVEKTTVNIRDVMAELRPQVLDDYGLAASLRWYRERFSQRSGIKVDLETATIEDTRLPEAVETALFRIIQEAFNNVVKHARAANVSVAAVKTAESIQLTIADDGQGFDAGAGRSSQHLQNWGLVNMRERAKALGGQFQIDSELGKGTRLRVEVPL